MIARAFTISFEYRLEDSSISINLRAEVEVHNDPFFYIVHNIRSLRSGSPPAIPDVRLTKRDSTWVHVDSEKPTDLTLSIGKAIDAHEHD